MSSSQERPTRLKLIELYASVQGESTHVGRPCTFIRLVGCHLRCTWCDSTYTFKGGDWWDLDQIMNQVAELGPRLVEVTGGEPLLQKGCVPLMQALLDANYEVLLETSGASDVSTVPDGVQIIMVEAARFRRRIEEYLKNLEHGFFGRNQVRDCLRRDYEWSRDGSSGI